MKTLTLRSSLLSVSSALALSALVLGPAACTPANNGNDAGTTTDAGGNNNNGDDAGTQTDGGGGGGVPAGWTCDDTWYGADDGCDCGCGVLDTDCADSSLLSCDTLNCPTGETPLLENNATCTAPVCGDGTNAGTILQSDVEECDDGNTMSGDGCSANCTVEEGYACPALGGACSMLPAGWTCSPNYYGTDDGCDCGCGAPDADCPMPTDLDSCEFDWCEDPATADPTDVTQCIGGGDGGVVDDGGTTTTDGGTTMTDAGTMADAG